MPLQLRLTLAIAGLIAALALAALLGLDALTADMRRALGDTVTEVSHSLVAVLGEQRREVQRIERVQRGSDAGDEAAANAAPDRDTELTVVVNGKRLDPQQIAALPAHLLHPAPAPAGEQHQRIQGEVRFEVHHAAGDASPMLLVKRADGGEASIPLPESRVDSALQTFRQRLLWGLGGLLLVGVAAAAVLARKVVAPLRQLGQAADALGSGALGVQVPADGPPEVRRSIAAFNRMSADLLRLQAEADSLRGDRELAELGEIGRGLAHSLRNPLHALGLSLESLAGVGNDSDHAARLAQSGREQLARIDQTLRGFLALSAGADAGVESVRLVELVEDVVLEASQRAAGRVRFERDIQPGGGALRLQGVAAELRIVLHTLVVNALEASPAGSTVRIEVRPAPAPQRVRIEVQDHGSGISPAIRARLFQPHVSSKPAGAGMGLYLAERLLRLRYHGELQLLEHAPNGTRAVLLLGDRESAHEH